MMHHPESRMQEFFSRRRFSLHVQIYTPIEEVPFMRQIAPHRKPSQPSSPPFPHPRHSPTHPHCGTWSRERPPHSHHRHSPTHPRHSRTHLRHSRTHLRHSRTPSVIPAPPPSFPHPPPSFPHPPTSFPRRRESLPPARIASGSQRIRHIAPLGAAAPEPSYQETKRNHNSANSFTRMRQEDRMPINAPSMKTVCASHEAR